LARQVFGTRAGSLGNWNCFGVWDIVLLVEPRQADFERPHTEDVWVRGIRVTGRTVPIERRGAILKATEVDGTKPLFGEPMHTTWSSAYLYPGHGDRSLVTVVTKAKELVFEASLREGAAEADIRVRLNLPEVGEKQLPVKDHALLLEAERHAERDPARMAAFLTDTVATMGRSVAVRLGLSRGYSANRGEWPARQCGEGVAVASKTQQQPATGQGEPRCWLMADGFFPIEGDSN
jgi:hypothetical protein